MFDFRKQIIRILTCAFLCIGIFSSAQAESVFQIQIPHALIPARVKESDSFQKKFSHSFELFKNFYIEQSKIHSSDHWIPQYSYLAGWAKRGTLIKSFEKANVSIDRLLDPVEQSKELSELFALHSVYFLSDPEFRCKKPALYSFFTKFYEVNSDLFASIPCSTNYNLRAFSYLSQEPLVFSLQPERVYAIDYLLAGQGSDMMSHFGHAMYRVVLCAPDTPFGPKCRQDTEHHLVISFRANIHDLNIDYWKGLNGGYPSKMYIFPFVDIVQEYTVTEQRNVQSFPMRLSAEQKADFIHRTLEMYWSYLGEYRFLSNNCASEASALLKGVLPSYATEGVCISPTGLLDELKDQGVVEKIKLSDISQMKRGLLYLPSLKIMEEQYDVYIRKNSIHSYPSFQKYLKLSPEKRVALFEGIENEEQRRTFAHFLLKIEADITRLKYLRFMKTVVATILKSAESDQSSEEENQLVEILKNSWKKFESSATQSKRAGYGIPTAEDTKEFESQTTEAMQELIQKIKPWIEKNLPKQLDSLKRQNDSYLFFMNQSKQALQKID